MTIKLFSSRGARVERGKHKSSLAWQYIRGAFSSGKLELKYSTTAIHMSWEMFWDSLEVLEPNSSCRAHLAEPDFLPFGDVSQHRRACPVPYPTAHGLFFLICAGFEVNEAYPNAIVKAVMLAESDCL